MLAIGELCVDLVGDHHDVRAPQHLGDGLQVLPAHNAAGGVVGEGQHQDLGPGGDGGAQLLGRKAEFVFRLGLHIDRSAPRHAGQRTVAHKGGHRHDDLVPGVHHTPQRQVDALASAHGDDDLAGKVIPELEAPLQVGGDLPPQLGHAGVGGIFGKALLQRVDARVPDVPGGDEIRLADPQGDGVLHLLQDVEELSDTGGLHLLDAAGENGIVIHVKISSLSCCSCFSKIRCFSLYFFRIKWVAVPVTSSMVASR